jgi:uncharacterized membrane protein (DUF373 family)
MAKFSVDQIFNHVVNWIFGVILLALILGLSIGTGKLFISIWHIFSSTDVTGKFLELITDVLTLFVLVELSKSLVDYFHAHRLRMTFIVDAAIVFLIREVMIMLFQHKASPTDIYAISILLLVLTILRIGSIMMFQRESKIVAAVKSDSTP